MGVAVVARVFGFGAREIMAMPVRELKFWLECAVQVLKLEAGKKERA